MRGRHSKISDETLLGVVMFLLLVSALLAYVKNRVEGGTTNPIIETILRPFQDPSALK